MAGERCSLWMPGVWCCARAGTGTSHPPSPRFVPGTVQLPTRRPWTASWSYGKSSRLAFERLQGRLQRRGAGAARLAEQWPAHFVAFDLLRLAGTDTTRWPYAGARAAAPERLFTEQNLTAPWALCPSFPPLAWGFTKLRTGP